jgi:FAD/FMN-containing dehydrogenase
MQLNDVHSRLNATTVRRVETPTSEAEVVACIERARAQGEHIAIAGGRHAMGGQQLLEDGVVLDMSGMDAVLGLDHERGLLRVEAGIQWPALLEWLEREQGDVAGIWSYRQKQTGADSLSIGGAVSANVHGRGLTLRPFEDEVESLVLIDADARRHELSRTQDPELFAAVIGGYGLLGVVTEVTLRLAPRQLLQRVVEVVHAADLPTLFADRIADGYEFGDWQYDIDPASPHYLDRGIFSCYRPVADGEAPEPSKEVSLDRDDWMRLVELVRTDKTLAFEAYRQHYLQTDGQHYWSDTHQNATYLDNYAELLQAGDDDGPLATLMISELYVPREQLPAFLRAAAGVLRDTGAEVLYGTVRLIEQDDHTLLAWAREPWACTIFNLLVEHDDAGRERAARAFRGLIDAALKLGGSYYLTYHRWATDEQLHAAHPRIGEFVEYKRRQDPDGRFRSNWFDQIQQQVLAGATPR